MVHSMDSLSSKWRDDPVRAALEKKKNREAAADRMAKANEIASELLRKRLESGAKADMVEDEDGVQGDADYKLVRCMQRMHREHLRALESTRHMSTPLHRRVSCEFSAA